MERLIFDESGRLLAVDGRKIDKKDDSSRKFKRDFTLKKSDSLTFLKEDNKKMEEVFDTSFWSLYSEGKKIEPLIFSNGKTQENVIKEILELIKVGNKIILLNGACGSGKSAIALNLARILGKTSIIVPVKALQRQYEEDYMSKKYLIKRNGQKMKIAMITGRDNHDSVIYPGLSCADQSLPENIKITEKNYDKLLKYYNDNPLIRNKVIPSIKDLRRVSVAPANPYWSPILPASFEISHFSDAKKKKYAGADGQDYIFYHRKEGCSYYDQYLSYIYADAIIFNSAKYKAELSIGRKPATEVEIIDEADEFLDSLFQQDEINLTRLSFAFKQISSDSISAQNAIKKIIELIELEEKNKRALGLDENKVYQIGETKIKDILSLLVKNPELESEIIIDEMNYANRVLESAYMFKENFDDVYVTYKKDDENLYVKLVSTNLASKLKDLMDKSKAIVLMSGTPHSESVLKNIFGIFNYKVVDAEMLNKGAIEIIRTGKEFDCKHSNLSSNKNSREMYLLALSECINRAIPPVLIHVNAFQDLPSEDEKSALGLHNLMSYEKLSKLQDEDKLGKAVSLFKSGLNDFLFTTKCSRGVDFPGKMCRTIVFTKYPNPNISDTFWKILQRTHSGHFWDFYKDKAKREFLQRIFRAVRSKEDHVYILSPDMRVINAVQKLQKKIS